MKKRKILVLFPLLGLLLTGCDFKEVMSNVKTWISENIYHPVKDFIDGKTGEDEKEKEDEGGKEEEKTVKRIVVESYPESVAEGGTIAASAVTVRVFYSDNTEELKTAEKVTIDTSVPGDNVPMTVEYGGKSDTVTVKVVAASEVVHVQSIKYDTGGVYTIDVGAELQITVNVEPENATDKSCTFTSSNEQVATVTSGGLVKGVSAGQVSIEIVSNDNPEAKKTLNLTVRAEAAGLPNKTARNFDKLEATVALQNGEKINIAGAIGEKYYVLPTYESGNNIKAKEINVENEALVIDEAYDLTVIKNANDTYSFAQANGKYLAATGGSSGNQLKAVDTLDEKAQFNVTVEDGYTLISNPTVERGHLCLNPNSGTAIFACYGEAKYEKYALYHNGQGTTGPVAVEGVEFTAEKYEVEVGSTVQVTANVTPATADDKEISYALKDVAPEGALTIEGNVITAVAEGSATVVAKSHDGGFEDEATVTAIAARNYGTLENPLSVSEAYALIEEVCPTDGKETEKVIYCEGLVSAKGTAKNWGYQSVKVKEGETELLIYTITMDEAQRAAHDEGKILKFHGYAKNYQGTLEFATCNNTNVYADEIRENFAPVEEVQLSEQLIEIELGTADKALTASVLPANADQRVTWAVGNENVATFENGSVHGVAVGETTVTATSVADPTKSATCSVKIKEKTKELVSVQIKTMPKVEYMEGDKLDLSNLVLTLNYDDQSTEDVTTGYTTNIALDHELTTEDTELIITYGKFVLDPIALTVTAKPKPTHAGTVEDPYTGEDAVIVANNLAAGGATEDSYYIKGVVVNFEENFNPSYGNYSFKIEGGFIGWRLKNGANGDKFKEGDLEVGDTVTMYVQIQSYIKNAGDTPKPESKNGYIVSIEKPVIAVQSIELSAQHLDLEVGQQAALSATVLPEKATNKEVTWLVTSGNEVAAVAKYEDGKVVALAAGEATVTATSVADPTIAASCTVTVSEPTKELLSLSITGEPTKLAYYHGEAYDPTGLKVMAHYNIGDDEDITSSATIVADKETASYGDTSVKFTASYGEKSAEASFIVTVEYKKGSEQLPYTVEEARAAIDGTESGKTAYVKGIVSRIAYAWANNSMSFYFSDNGSTNNEIEAYKLAATADPGVEVGDLVVVKGQLTKYNTTYELNTGCTLESLTKATVESVTISGTPQTDYIENDKYNHNGLVATAHLNTGLDIDVTNDATWAFSKETAEQGDSEISITATYKGVSSTALVVQVNVEAQGQAVERTVSWTASAANNLGSQISAAGGTATGTISTGDFSWNYTRTLVNLKSGKNDYIAMQGNTWIQLGSSSALESLELSTSAIPGKIKSITVVAATAGTHTLTIEVGDSKYLDKAALTTYSGNAAATNPDPANCAVTGTGTASGAIKITIASSATTTNKAVLIRSITVVYEA